MSTSARRPPTWAVITVLSLAGMLAALQQTLVVPLTPEIPQILGVSDADASWMVTITLLTGAVATPIVSRLADMFGKKRMILTALVCMVAGSLMLAIGTGFVTALVGRALQGFAAAMIPVGISIMRDELPPARVGFGVALMSATLGIGSALGLPLSGVLFDHFGWHSLFWVSAGFGVLVTVGVYLLVDESDVRSPGRFDYRGAVLLSVALTSFLLAITNGGQWGWTSPGVLGCLALAAVVMAAWFPYELRVGEPLVDLRTSARKPVLLTNVASVLIAFAMYVNMLLTVQQLELPAATGYGFGLDVSAAGLAMVPSGLVMVLLSPVSGTLLSRYGGRSTMLLGAAIMAGGYLFRIFVHESVLQIIIGATVVGMGTAFAFAAMPTLIMAAVPITETASANGLNSLMRAVGGSTSSAVLAAILTSMTVGFAGRQIPAEHSFTLMFWLSVLACFIACLVILRIPVPSRVAAGREGVPAVAVAGDRSETVVHGRILPGGDVPRQTHTVVTVTRMDGRPVDWARCDNEGRFSVALPGAGQYLLIGNAGGWAPQAQVLDFRGGSLQQDVALERQLTLSGTVTDGGAVVPGALVTLHQGVGDFVLSDHADDEGEFTVPLPSAGIYIVSAAGADSGRAASRKITVGARSEVVDIDLALEIRADA
ncbi:MFS transporter [Nocardioides jensenii]|uniref:MFS transporter n=1 Tax=Nocardioides jensenii TaxID=1843 RepID=UPI0008296AF7|nr:MFS transporter [Nocardioides jensenii]